MGAVFAAKLPTKIKFVLLALADSADDTGHCWPSVRTLARKTSLSRSSVFVALEWLEKENFLKRSKRFSGTRQTSSDYWLNLELIGKAGVQNTDPPPSKLGTLPRPESGLPPVHSLDTSYPSYEPKEESKYEPAAVAVLGKEKDMKVEDIAEKYSKELEDEEILGELKYLDGLLFPTSLYRMYKLAFAKYYTGKFISLTKKDQAVLKQMIVQSPDQEKIGPAIFAAMKNWKGFCKYVEKNTSAFNLPAMPDMTIMLKYLAQVLQYADEKLASSKYSF